MVSLNSLQGTKMRKQNQGPALEPRFYFLRVGSKNELSSVCCCPAFSEHCQIRGRGDVELQKEAVCWTDAAAACAGRPLPCLTPVFPQYWKTPARQDWQKHCGSASRMMGLASVPYFSLEYLVRSASPA